MIHWSAVDLNASISCERRSRTVVTLLSESGYGVPGLNLPPQTRCTYIVQYGQIWSSTNTFSTIVTLLFLVVYLPRPLSVPFLLCTSGKIWEHLEELILHCEDGPIGTENRNAPNWMILRAKKANPVILEYQIEWREGWSDKRYPSDNIAHPWW